MSFPALAVFGEFLGEGLVQQFDTVPANSGSDKPLSIAAPAGADYVISLEKGALQVCTGAYGQNMLIIFESDECRRPTIPGRPAGCRGNNRRPRERESEQRDGSPI